MNPRPPTCLPRESKTTDLLASLTAKIDVLATEIAQTQADNYASKANGGAGWILEGEYSAAVKAIKDYLNQRFVYLDTKFKELSANESVETVELIDGQPYTNTADQTVEKVTYTRTFSSTQAGKWQPLYIPFDLTITSELISNYDFAAPEYAASNALHIITLSENNVIKANKPYFIKPHSAGTEVFTAENVTLAKAETVTGVDCSSTLVKYTFHGNYAGKYSTGSFLCMSQGKIGWNNGYALGTFRWFMTAEDKNGNMAKITPIIIEDNNDATGISTTTRENEPESYYSPNGIQLEKPVKGLNIIKMKDGSTRKVIVR